MTTSPKGALLAFCQANLAGGREEAAGQDDSEDIAGEHGGSAVVRGGDGRGGWTDIALRRSTDDGKTWGKLQVICRNSTLGADGKRNKTLEQTCQQPAPVADHTTGKVFFLSSPNNWFQRVIESSDDGLSWTPWHQATDLDSTCRKPGWGLVFNGLPGGVQLVAPNPKAGRLIICSSAYWSGGAMDGHGNILKAGDHDSRYSFTIISDE